mmetsp:Transcript_23477/g.37409  ORF Transcript_23477/g.37409 Transcript_23477/m.37409 type:complete len:320 (-) Transcript_23477:1541-2500(-)
MKIYFQSTLRSHVVYLANVLLHMLHCHPTVHTDFYEQSYTPVDCIPTCLCRIQTLLSLATGLCDARTCHSMKRSSAAMYLASCLFHISPLSPRSSMAIASDENCNDRSGLRFHPGHSKDHLLALRASCCHRGLLPSLFHVLPLSPWRSPAIASGETRNDHIGLRAHPGHPKDYLLAMFANCCHRGLLPNPNPLPCARVGKARTALRVDSIVQNFLALHQNSAASLDCFDLHAEAQSPTTRRWKAAYYPQLSRCCRKVLALLCLNQARTRRVRGPKQPHYRAFQLPLPFASKPRWLLLPRQQRTEKRIEASRPRRLHQRW